MQARFDKRGRKLPDTGHGCGCQLCADAGAPRYERRRAERASSWTPLRRHLALAVARVTSSRPESAYKGRPERPASAGLVTRSLGSRQEPRGLAADVALGQAERLAVPLVADAHGVE